MSRFIKNTITGFKTFNVYQKVSAFILIITVPLMIALGVSAITGGVDDTSLAVSNSASSSSQQALSASSSASSSSVIEDIKITLNPSSVEEDLEVEILNENGEMIVGVDFVLTVKGVDNYYEKDWDVNDGFLKLTKLTAGEYTVSIEELEGYIMPEAVTVEVAEKVAYEEQDVSDKVVDESEIDPSTEDSAFEGTVLPTAPPAPSDTVEYVKSEAKQEDVEKEVDVIKYKPVLHADGSISLQDNSASGYYPEYDSQGYLIGAYKYDGATVANLSNTLSFTPSYLTYNNSPLNILLLNTELPDPVTSPPASTAPTTQPPASTAPTIQPPASTAPPTIQPPASTAPPTIQPPASTAPPTTQPPASTAPPTMTPPTGEKVSVDIFDEDGKPLTDGSGKTILKLTQETVKETVTEKETVYYGWQDIDGKTYYFDKNGKKIIGTHIIQGKSYFFDEDGVLFEGNTIGIDVSKWQGTINWQTVKDAGIDFAIIRVGYRGYSTGAVVEDTYFKQNIQGATQAGLKVGVYFFSQAITAEEAVIEASMAIQAVRGYNLALPIYFDSEYSTSAKTGRADKLSQSHRTAVAKAFCETVENSGYQAGIYASASWFYYQLDYSQISQYDIWVAHYTAQTDFRYHYDIWQYTGSGSCAGVAGHVDLNIAYTRY